MRRSGIGTIIAAALLLAGAGAAIAGPEKIAYPEGYREGFALYQKIDKPERRIVRFLYINAKVVAMADSVGQLPYGTVIVMEDHKVRLDADGKPVRGADDRLIPTDEIANVIVMEKGQDWGAAYAEDARNGDWEYAVFNPDRSRRADVQYGRCFACHKGQVDQDYTFTITDDVLGQLKR